MNKSNNLLKYEVINTKKDKKLIGEVFDFKKVKTNGGPSNDRTPPKKQKSTRDLLIQFMGEQREFNKTIVNRLDRVIKVNRLKE